MQDSFNSSLLTPQFLIFSPSVVGEGKGDFFVITPGVFGQSLLCIMAKLVGRGSVAVDVNIKKVFLKKSFLILDIFQTGRGGRGSKKILN